MMESNRYGAYSRHSASQYGAYAAKEPSMLSKMGRYAHGVILPTSASSTAWHPLRSGKEELLQGFGLGHSGIFNKHALNPAAGNIGKGVGAAFRGIPLAFTAYEAYGGYKEGGLRGAAIATAKASAVNFAAGMIMTMPGAIGVAGAAAVGGAYLGLKAGNARTKRTRNLEMGSPLVDPFGNAGTMRQRSLQALSNSQLNGRSAFGSEAQLMHVPYMR